ncbi:radical SAM protein [Actinoplanes sp. CA-030573]|uniref:radical SAM protein n=1 Tax=Actinoplanes sp. CA-030573 TaxID=3239898 RepID=UPI003D8A7CCC
MSAPGTAPPVAWSTQVRVRDGVRFRREAFGGVAYVPELDRFAALDHRAAGLVAGHRAPADHEEWSLASELTAAGILDGPPAGDCRPPAGRSLIGAFDDLPALEGPLVVNTFATAFCPLRCRYCHADDLMQPFRAGESDEDLERVARTAAAVPAMVAVITGGDPIVSPVRSARLIEKLAGEKAIVVDTSGAGDVTPLIPLLKGVQGHLRVSLDSAGAALHDRLRPISPRLLPRGTSSHAAAWATIHRAVEADVAVTVQTVVTRANEDPGHLASLAGALTRAGVRNWVLHVVVPAGKAAEPRNRALLPGADVSRKLAEVVERVDGDLRVRVTATHANPNAVLLVGSRGDVYAETGPAGKVKIAEATGDRDALLRLFRDRVDLRAHANRYLGGTAPFRTSADA